MSGGCININNPLPNNSIGINLTYIKSFFRFSCFYFYRAIDGAEVCWFLFINYFIYEHDLFNEFLVIVYYFHIFAVIISINFFLLLLKY